MLSDLVAETLERFLQQEQQEQWETMNDEEIHPGRTVLTVLYLCLLGLCLVVPVFYYFRMHCEERHARRIRELEISGISEALEQSQTLHRDESRAARRKYRDERRARIVQLFAPVRMVLKEDNFPHLREKKAGAREISDASTSVSIPPEESKETTENATTIGDTSTDSMDIEQGSQPLSAPPVRVMDDAEEDDVDEDELFVEIPAAGLQFAGGPQKIRLVSNVCSICLCNYRVGADVVWSSNDACDHAFHELCIEQWLMKQREGPLCPCCRRDFILDPYDLEEEGESKEMTDSQRALSLYSMELGELSDGDGDGGEDVLPLSIPIPVVASPSAQTVVPEVEVELEIAAIAVMEEGTSSSSLATEPTPEVQSQVPEESLASTSTALEPEIMEIPVKEPQPSAENREGGE